MTSEKKRDSGFEQDLEKLETIVHALEEGGLTLEDALKQFEAGIRLTRKCEKALQEADRKIEMLMRNLDGELEARPFEEDAAPTPATQEPAPSAVEAKERRPINEEEPPDPYYEEDAADLDELF